MHAGNRGPQASVPPAHWLQGPLGTSDLLPRRHSLGAAGPEITQWGLPIGAGVAVPSPHSAERKNEVTCRPCPGLQQSAERRACTQVSQLTSLDELDPQPQRGGNGTREGQGLGPWAWVPLEEGWEPASCCPPMLSAPPPAGRWVPRWADRLGHVPGVGWASRSCSAGVATRRPPLQAVS